MSESGRWLKACAAIRAAFSTLDVEQILRVSGHEPQAIADAFAIGQAEDLTAWAFSLPDDQRRAYLGDTEPVPTGVAAISGAAPELPEDSLLFRTLEAEVDEEDALAMPEEGIWAGPEGARALLAALGHAEHVDPDTTTKLKISLSLACDAFERLQADNASLRWAIEMLNVAAKEREEDVERLRAWCRRDAVDDGHLPRCVTRPSDAAPHENSMTARVYVDGAVWERMKWDLAKYETEQDNLRGAVEMLKQAAAGHVAEIERMTKERDEAVAACSRLVDVDQRLGRLEERLSGADKDNLVSIERIEAALEVKLCDAAEPVSDRLTRIHALTLLRNRASRAKAETLARWKRRASKSEQRIAALEQERDGEVVRGKVMRSLAITPPSWSPPDKRKATRAKGGR